MYMLSRLVMYNTYMRSFQYKILSNVLFFNKELHIFGNSHLHCVLSVIFTTKCNFHILCEYDYVKCLWSDLVQCFQNSLILQTLTPQTVNFMILDYTSNHILLIFKLYLYKFREESS